MKIPYKNVNIFPSFFFTLSTLIIISKELLMVSILIKKYLKESIICFKKGICSENPANKFLVNFHPAERLPPNRILRLYAITPDPKSNMKILMLLLLKMYARVCFVIKCKTSYKDGVILFLEIIIFPEICFRPLKMPWTQ